MKNPHGVEPTRYMKREESRYAIYCDPNRGPIFLSNNDRSYIYIGDECNRQKNSYIQNDGRYGYECHPKYKSSLFVNTAGPEEKNYFSVFDYEVYCIDCENRENISKLCKHPDIIWEYIETRDISEESLKQLNDESDLFNDLDVIHCYDEEICLKISRFFLKDSSYYLPNTLIVNRIYDKKIRKWFGNDYQWRLLFRASEHEYSAKSFHDYCDNKGPTLIVIKSSEGWIFGGYTTQSWSGRSIL